MSFPYWLSIGNKKMQFYLLVKFISLIFVFGFCC